MAIASLPTHHRSVFLARIGVSSGARALTGGIALALLALGLGGLDCTVPGSPQAWMKLPNQLWTYPGLLTSIGTLLLVAELVAGGHSLRHARQALDQAMRKQDGLMIELEQTASKLESATRRMAIIETNLPGLVFERLVSATGAASYPLLGGNLLSVLGLTPEQARRDPSRVISCIHPGDRRRWDALLHASEHACAGFADTFRIIGMGGKVFWAKCVASAQPAPEGGVTWTGLWIDVTAQKLACEAADAANRAKGDFLATMSHELRTPLNAIIGFNDLLLEKALSEDERRYATLTRDAGSMLLWVVDQVLAFSKVEHGRALPQRISFSLSSLIDGSVALVSPLLQKKSVPVEIALAPDLPERLLGDPEKLRQILVNLLSNAGKFTSSGAVKLWVSRLDHEDGKLRMRFAVIDSGCGIAPDRLERLFERYTQADPATGWNFGGTGLGLAICRRLIEGLGGTIGATSRLGEGSTFWFEVELGVGEPPNPAEEPAIAERPPAPRPARILVAEDIAFNRELISAYLEEAGHTVHLVQNGAEALEAASSGSYDLLMMDVQMPVMNGIEATRAIRALPGPIGSVPIVATTAGAFPQDLERCRSAGMNAHISKPFNKPDMLKTVALWTRPQSADHDDVVRIEVELAASTSALNGLIERLGAVRIKEYLAKFVADMPALIAYTEGDQQRPDLQAVVHKLLGSAGQLGFDGVSRSCRAVLSRLHDNPGFSSEPEVQSLHAALLKAVAVGKSLLESRFPSASLAELGHPGGVAGVGAA